MKILTTGETGAEEGALIAARKCACETGGLASSRRTDSLPRAFNLRQASTQRYQRKKAMVAQSDLVVFVGRPKARQRKVIEEYAAKASKPFLCVDHSKPDDAAWVIAWTVAEQKSNSLFVTGETEERTAGMKASTEGILTKALHLINAKE